MVRKSMLALLFVVVCWPSWANAIMPGSRSPQESRKNAEAIVKAGEWTVLTVQHPRVLGSLGRVQVVIESGKERWILKFSQTGDAPTLAKGDVVTFTLATLLEGKGVEGLPAVETPWGGKVPSLHPFEVGSYLIPHRKR